METFTFRGVAVHYRKMKASRILAHPFGSRTHPAVCALLERDIVEGEEVYLLLSNWKLFDNCWAVASEFERLGVEESIAKVTSKQEILSYHHSQLATLRKIFGDNPHTLPPEVAPKVG
jgi:hypothetical protein